MYNFKENEEKILKFWKEEKIYEKVKLKNIKGKKFYLMDGPPYATGHIHMGTALNKILKDISMRAKRSQGFDVFDRAGYDTHGVPIEFQIEKEIGSKSKQDIEVYGVKKFIERCKEFATEHIDEMNEEFENLGIWMNLSNPYLTLSNEYIETIWDAFKEADKKELLYLGKYPVHLCPRCETAVAYNEIEYTKQDDNSIYVKFPIKEKNKENTFLIIWTTTPWTLPANTGVMVHPDYLYQEIEISSGERWIIAKDLVPRIMESIGYGYTIKKEFKGRELEGMKYENPLNKNLKLKLKKAYQVILSGRYVNLEDGTGLVHCAPGHGKEDYEVGKEYGLDMPSPVDINGNLTEEAGKYAGKKARIVDKEIIADLEKDGFLVYQHKYSHDYPLCWRCKSPLLMVSQPQWFFRISKIQDKILKENENTNWIPAWVKLRMKGWLEGVSDWPVSRKRYWGTPIPIWICNECNEKLVIGSIKELEKLSGKKVTDLHKPEIDDIKIKCQNKNCKGIMSRVPEVLDVWFDSGVSSWAALNQEEFKKFWPADLNIEGKDQIRGWWNSQFILSQIKFGKKPFESIMMHGMVLDLGKRKMSKSLGNITSPESIIEKYGRDYLRYYLAKSSKGEDFAFNENEFKEIQNIFRVLININAYISQIKTEEINQKNKNLNIEDLWILSKLNTLIKETTKKYNEYLFFEVIGLLENFLIADLSKRYIQLTRERGDETYSILTKIRNEILKIFSPIIPFITESIWQELRKNNEVKEESIFLSEWQKCNEKEINFELENEFDYMFDIIEKGLAERDKSQIGLKWPLASAEIIVNRGLNDNLIKLIKKQLNIKKIELNLEKENREIIVKLNTTLTPVLEGEGFMRELTRTIQAERKNNSLTKEDKINLMILLPENLSKEVISEIEKSINELKEKVNAQKFIISRINESNKEEKNKFEVKVIKEIKGKTFEIYFNILK